MNTVILTRELIEKALTPRGGITRAQLEATGIKTTNNSGWKEALIGVELTTEQYNKFITPQYSKATLKMRRKEEARGEQIQMSFLNDSLDSDSDDDPEAPPWNDEPTVVMTAEYIARGQNPYNGTYKHRQLEILGIQYPYGGSDLMKAIGKRITLREYNEFLEIRKAVNKKDFDRKNRKRS